MTSLIYMALCSVYIVFSGRLAASAARSTEELQRIESAKGIAFVLVTGAIFFAFSVARYRHAQRQDMRIAEQERRLLVQERQRVAAMSASSIAHDINNLLMSLEALVADLRGREARDASLAQTRRGVEAGIGSLSRLSQRLASSARAQLPESEEVLAVGKTLAHIAGLVRKHPDVVRCVLKLENETTANVRLDAVLLEEAVVNMLINAAQAAGPDGLIELRSSREGDAVRIEVHDSGPGVPKDDVEQIFDPGFTTKREGTGLGLLALKALAASCEGEIEIGRSPLGGAAFSLTVPGSRVTEAPSSMLAV